MCTGTTWATVSGSCSGTGTSALVVDPVARGDTGVSRSATSGLGGLLPSLLLVEIVGPEASPTQSEWEAHVGVPSQPPTTGGNHDLRPNHRPSSSEGDETLVTK